MFLKFRRALSVSLVIFLFLCAAVPARAQDFSLIRDAEIENTIRTYLTPILQSAGLSPGAIEIYIVNDPAINAFATAGNRIFVHTGLLMNSSDPLEVIGVLAHEVGHITGGHILGRAEEIENATLKALGTQLLAIGAAIASGDGRVGAAVSAAGQDVALKSYLSFSRSQENAADQAGITYLERAGYSPKGLLEVLRTLQDQELLATGGNSDPYLRSHPLTQDRIAFIEKSIHDSKVGDRDASAELQMKQARMQAKLYGFLGSTNELTRYYPRTSDDLATIYANAIFDYRAGRFNAAITELDSLLKDHPDDPFFNELRGQMLFEYGRVKESLPNYRKAAALRPFDAQLQFALAQNLIQINSTKTDQEALKSLNFTLLHEPQNVAAWRLVAIAQGRLGNKGEAALALAEMNYAQGDAPSAIQQAIRAQKLLKENSPSWLRAGDLKSAIEQYIDRR